MFETQSDIAERPLLAGAVLALLMLVIFGGIDLLLAGSVDLVRTLVRAVLFSAVYVGLTVYFYR